MKAFYLQRDTDVSGVSGTGRVADGILLESGTVILRWLGEWPTTVIHERGMASVEHIHGHDGKTRIVWEE